MCEADDELCLCMTEASCQLFHRSEREETPANVTQMRSRTLCLCSLFRRLPERDENELHPFQRSKALRRGDAGCHLGPTRSHVKAAWLMDGILQWDPNSLAQANKHSSRHVSHSFRKGNTDMKFFDPIHSVVLRGSFNTFIYLSSGSRSYPPNERMQF